MAACSPRDADDTPMVSKEPTGYDAAYSWYVGRADVSLLALEALEAGDTQAVRQILQLETMMTAWILPSYEVDCDIADNDKAKGQQYAYDLLAYLEKAVPKGDVARKPTTLALNGIELLAANDGVRKRVEALRKMLPKLSSDLGIPYDIIRPFENISSEEIPGLEPFVKEELIEVGTKTRRWKAKRIK